ncbi:MAG: hypothetical protein ACON42_07840 [Flavobacteriaceae bacterium]
MPQNRFLFLLFLIVLPCLTYFLHECTHWLVYRFYGIDARLDLNTISLPQEIGLTSTQQFIIYGSGVFFSLIQGIIGYFIALRKDIFIGSSLLLSAAVFRWAAILQGIVSSSDEIKMSQAMGVYDSVWPLIISGSFFMMLFYVYKKGRLEMKFICGISLIFLLITYLYSLI